jgi:SAM-dependent methyltransferase
MSEWDLTLPPVPWTWAYNEVRERALRAAVIDADLLHQFAAGLRLPEGYGRGLDERCVEFPWLLSQLPAGSARLLDAGSTLNDEFLLECPVLADKRLHIVTLAPEEKCFWSRRISYLFEDLRALPLASGAYDLVASVSTIEHVGCDNRLYTHDPRSAEQRLDDFEVAVAELARVLQPGGTLLLTVPYGRYQFHGTFQQFDRARLSRAEAAFGPAASIGERFYRYSAAGWQLARDEECDESEYVAWVADLMRTGRWPDPPRLESDYAAAARAVACVRLTKR